MGKYHLKALEMFDAYRYNLFLVMGFTFSFLWGCHASDPNDGAMASDATSIQQKENSADPLQAAGQKACQQGACVSDPAHSDIDRQADHDHDKDKANPPLTLTSDLKVDFLPMAGISCAYQLNVSHGAAPQDAWRLMWSSSASEHQDIEPLDLASAQENHGPHFHLAENETVQIYAQPANADASEALPLSSPLSCDASLFADSPSVALNVHADHVDLTIQGNLTSQKNHRYLAYLISDENYCTQVNHTDWTALDTVIVTDPRMYKPVFRKKGLKTLRAIASAEHDGQKLYVLLVDQSDNQWKWTYLTSFIIDLHLDASVAEERDSDAPHHDA
jgi:hypothetical protein